MSSSRASSLRGSMGNHDLEAVIIDNKNIKDE
jgi:hypothetical protein